MDKTAAVRSQIERIYVRLVEALKRGDVAAIGAAFTADSAMLMLDSTDPPVRGRQAVQAVFQGLLGMGRVVEAAFTMDEIFVDGDTAYESGSNMITLEGATRVTLRGRYVTIWRRQPDGSWQVFRDIGNTPKP